MLSACAPGFQTLPGGVASSASSAFGVQENAVSNKILDDVAEDLRKNAVTTAQAGLSEAEIRSLIESTKASLQAGGLGSVTDLRALLPGLVGSLSQSLGKLHLGASSPQVAELIATIGQSVLGSSTSLPTSVSKTELMELISKSLFQNLPATGVSSGNLSGVAGTVMNQLVAHLGQQGLSTTSLSTLLQSLTSGAALGVGNLNLGSISGTQIQEILRQIGLGSAQGLSGVASGTSGGDVLKTLINSVVNGATQGLNQSAGAKKGLDVKQLLTSLISGQATGLADSGVSTEKQKPASLLLQLLLSRVK